VQLGKLILRDEAYWASLFDPSAGNKRLTIFGEHCGKGIQKGVALANLPTDLFCVFAVDRDGAIDFEPDSITAQMTKKGTVQLPKQIHVLPWYTVPPGAPPASAAAAADGKSAAGAAAAAGTGSEWSLVFDDDKQMELPVANINHAVALIDAEDPWVLKTFGVKGNGEGLVFFPLNLTGTPTPTTVSKQQFGDFAFKAKGSAHRTVASKHAASTKPEAAVAGSGGESKEEAFAKMVLTEARLVQGLQAVCPSGAYDKKATGAFVKWIETDVQKECGDNLTASGLVYKGAVGKAIVKAAQNWWLNKAPLVAIDKSK
jgi:hypothetical protein